MGVKRKTIGSFFVKLDKKEKQINKKKKNRRKKERKKGMKQEEK